MLNARLLSIAVLLAAPVMPATAQDMAPQMQCTMEEEMPGMGVGTEHWQAGAAMTPWASAGRWANSAAVANTATPTPPPSSRRRKVEGDSMESPCGS